MQSAVPRLSDESKITHIGVLGAARINKNALFLPVGATPNARVTAIASRQKQKAQDDASKYGITKTLNSYDEVINDGAVEAVFNPLPNSSHCHWTIESVKRGKHVLCEKPLCSNAAEARAMKKAVDDFNAACGTPTKRLVVVEAFHWKNHPLIHFVVRVLKGAEPGWPKIGGKIVAVNTQMHIPNGIIPDDDIRYNFALAGGALMDCSYVISTSRFVAKIAAEAHAPAATAQEIIDATVATVAAAQPTKWAKDSNIDQAMEADLVYPTGVKSHISCTLSSSSRVSLPNHIHIFFEDGSSLFVDNFLFPYVYNSVTLKDKNGAVVMKNGGVFDAEKQSTYYYQLKAFLAAVEAVKKGTVGEDLDGYLGTLNLTTMADAVANMETIDRIYVKADLPIRPSSAKL